MADLHGLLSIFTKFYKHRVWILIGTIFITVLTGIIIVSKYNKYYSWGGLYK